MRIDQGIVRGNGVIDSVLDAVALAWATHDLGIWTAGTFDYLPPSLELVDTLAPEVGVADTAPARAMVELHHRIRRMGAHILRHPLHPLPMFRW